MDSTISRSAPDADRWQHAIASQPATSGAPPSGRAAAPGSARAADPVEAPLPREFLESLATKAVGAPRIDAKDAGAQRQLDAFRAAMTGSYRTPDGQQLGVATPFRMSSPYPAQVETLKEHPEIGAAAARAGLALTTLNRVESGRGSPAEIHSLTQALIDLQPPGAPWSQVRIRKLMFDCGVGVDCASYAQQAYLRVAGTSRVQAGLGSPLDENLSGLGRRGFSRIDDVADLRPGDLVVLGQPPPAADGRREPGHRAIVYDQRPASAGELRAMAQSASAEERAFLAGGPIRVVDVDSSWGCGGKYQAGGVMRAQWLFNESTRMWASGSGGTFRSQENPYASDPLEGFYRRGER